MSRPPNSDHSPHGAPPNSDSDQGGNDPGATPELFIRNEFNPEAMEEVRLVESG